MKLLRLNALPSNTQLEKTAVTIGNFDGVHLGHQAMIHQLKAVAKYIYINFIDLFNIN
jgi:riboflavin kinase / FMN adenylyltransferase